MGERIDGESEQITYTEEITYRESERKRWRWETRESGKAKMKDKEWVRERMHSGRVNERDGDGRHGRMHAGNAAHHRGDSLGPVHSERMKDNE